MILLLRSGDVEANPGPAERGRWLYLAGVLLGAWTAKGGWLGLVGHLCKLFPLPSEHGYSVFKPVLNPV